ncbi:MAG TPA: rhodanese-like domain-containing protein [Thermoanaerobaculia bacterium]|nr:rhodanese-like domain-containing protein [Thermoanaerobaculia bacterium]
MLFIALLFAITTKADVPRMQAAELRAAMEKGEAVAIDVRGTVPWELEHIKDAVWMPLGVMKERAGSLPEEKVLVTYCTCKAEETSLEAAMLLSSMGFTKVAVLHGGFPAWKNAGLPVVSNRTPAPAAPATPAPPATPVASGGRFAPPEAVTCDRNKLTSYVGTVRDYVRGNEQTTLTIDTTAATTEHVTIRRNDPSRAFLIFGEPFTDPDWKRIEAKPGQLLPDMSAVAWVCEDGTVIIDWRPGSRFTGAE